MLRSLIPLLLLALVLASATTFAQHKLVLSPRVSYGSFSMGHLRDLQQQYTHSEAIKLEVTDAFPAYYMFGLAGGFQLHPKFITGILAEAGSTGGRVAYSDYSGSYKADQLLRYVAGGIFTEYQQNKNNFKFTFGLETTYVRSFMTLSYKLQIGTESNSDNQKLVTGGIGLRPYTGIHYTVGRFVPSVNLGYQLYKGNPFHLPGDRDADLMLNNNKIGPDWSGFRVTLAIGLLLF